MSNHDRDDPRSGAAAPAASRLNLSDLAVSGLAASFVVPQMDEQGHAIDDLFSALTEKTRTIFDDVEELGGDAPTALARAHLDCAEQVAAIVGSDSRVIEHIQNSSVLTGMASVTLRGLDSDGNEADPQASLAVTRMYGAMAGQQLQLARVRALIALQAKRDRQVH